MAKNRKIQRAEKMAEQAALQQATQEPQIAQQPLAHRLLANLTANADPAAQDAYEAARDARISQARATGKPQVFGIPSGPAPSYDEWGQDVAPAKQDDGKEASGGDYKDVPEEALGSSKDFEQLKAKVDELAKKVEGK